MFGAMFEGGGGYSTDILYAAKVLGRQPWEIQQTIETFPGWSLAWQLARDAEQRKWALEAAERNARHVREAEEAAKQEAVRPIRWRTRLARCKGYPQPIPVVDFDFRQPGPANAGALREYFAHGPVENWWYYEGDMGKAQATLVAWCREVIGNGADREEVLRTLFYGELRRGMDAAIGPVEPPAAIVALKEAFAA